MTRPMGKKTHIAAYYGSDFTKCGRDAPRAPRERPKSLPEALEDATCLACLKKVRADFEAKAERMRVRREHALVSVEETEFRIWEVQNGA